MKSTRDKVSKQIIRIVCTSKNRVHYFQFFDFETIKDLKNWLVKKYNYPDYLVISSKGHLLKDNEKIIDYLNDNKELSIIIQANFAKLSKDHKSQ